MTSPPKWPPTSSTGSRDWDGLSDAAAITEGSHTLKIVVDPENAVREANEDDNVYEKTFVWSDEPVVESGPAAYTEEDLLGKLSALPLLVEIREPALSDGGFDYSREVLDITDAGYYLLTGKSIHNERLAIHFFTRAEFKAWIDDYFAERFALTPPSEHPTLLERRERIKATAVGITVPRFGRTTVAIDAERGLADVVQSLAHELGHVHQRHAYPAVGERGSDHAQRGIREAQAQQFERAFWLKLEELTGEDLLSYPDYEGFHVFVNRRLASWQAGLSLDEHFLGYLVQWLAVAGGPQPGGAPRGAYDTGGARRGLIAEAVRVPGHSAAGRRGRVRGESSRYAGRQPEDDSLHGDSQAGSRTCTPTSEGSPDLRETGLLAP